MQPALHPDIFMFTKIGKILTVFDLLASYDSVDHKVLVLTQFTQYNINWCPVLKCLADIERLWWIIAPPLNWLYLQGTSFQLLFNIYIGPWWEILACCCIDFNLPSRHCRIYYHVVARCLAIDSQRIHLHETFTAELTN